jgi:hypothetical protein
MTRTREPCQSHVPVIAIMDGFHHAWTYLTRDAVTHTAEDVQRGQLELLKVPDDKRAVGVDDDKALLVTLGGVCVISPRAMRDRSVRTSG